LFLLINPRKKAQHEKNIIEIIKRDGKRENFSVEKIANAIRKAHSAGGVSDNAGEIVRI